MLPDTAESHRISLGLPNLAVLHLSMVSSGNGPVDGHDFKLDLISERPPIGENP